jgi:hypothetical protein
VVSAAAAAAAAAVADEISKDGMGQEEEGPWVM